MRSMVEGPPPPCRMGHFPLHQPAAGLPPHLRWGGIVRSIVGDGINRIMRRPDKAVILITHYQRLLDYVRPDFVHVLADGRIVRSGGPELAHELEREGYGAVAA